MNDLNLSLIIASALNFILLFFLFYYFLGKKLTNLIEDRKKALNQSLQAQEESKKRLEEAQEESKKILENSKNKAIDIESKAENLAKQKSKSILEKAQKEANHFFENSKQQLQKEKIEMQNSLRSRILDLTLRLNSKIFSKKDANREFFEKEIEFLK